MMQTPITPQYVAHAPQMMHSPAPQMMQSCQQMKSASSVGDETGGKGKGSKGKSLFYKGKDGSFHEVAADDVGLGGSSSSSWQPKKTGWLNKCCDLVVCVLQEDWEHARALANHYKATSSLAPLIPDDIRRYKFN
jgi:hypothetical protein